MVAQTIRADGMDWPLETFLDARGFVRVDRFETPAFRDALGDPRMDVVTIGGELAVDVYASAVSWPDTIAFRLVDDTGEPCFWCGTSTDEEDMCDRCEADCEYD